MKPLSDLLDNYGNEQRKTGELPQQRGAKSLRDPLAPKPDTCPICKGKGFLIYDVPPGDPRFNRLVPCRCTEARLIVERTRTLRDISNLAALERFTFDSFLPDGIGGPSAVRASLRGAYEACYAYAQQPRGWIVLLGGYGSGKTHLAAAIANYNLALGRPVMFVVVPDLLDHLRAAYAPNSETGVDERLDTIREAPLLVLDDLGAHNSTAWAQEKLFQIINYRYNAQLATVMTSNLRLEEIDPRISSRLADLDLSQLVEIDAPDFRGGSQSLIGTANRGVRDLNALALYTENSLENFSMRLEDEMLAEQRKGLRDALEQAREYAADPSGWLIFSGTYGSGKTHLASAIANYQVEQGKPSPMLVVVPDLLDHLRSTFAPTSTISLDRAFEQIKAVWLLVLDDLGTENATLWAKEKLFQLMNHRYVTKLPTIITTHQTLEELDPHIASRMSDLKRGRIVYLNAPPYRGSESQERAVKRASPKRNPK